MRKQILVVSMLLATTAYAQHGEKDDVLLEAGLGTFSTEGKSLSQVKFFKLGIQEDLWYAFRQRFNGGLWLDSRGDGRASSLFASYQIGFDVQNDIYEMGVFSGPGLISTPDCALGGHFQFNETVFFGIRDPKAGDSIGISYNHFSSAGLEMPNMGKDFMSLEIKFPF